MLETNGGPDGASECSYATNPDSPVRAIASTVRRRRFARSDRRQRSHRPARQADDCVRGGITLAALRRRRDRVAVKCDRPVNRRWASEAIVRFDCGEIGKEASRGGRGRVVGWRPL